MFTKCSCDKCGIAGLFVTVSKVGARLSLGQKEDVLNVKEQRTVQ
jgi:hypothetical protein